PNADDVWKMQAIRNHAKNLAFLINSYVPEGREKSLALTNLEQVSMWSNAGIVRNEPVTMTLASVEHIAGVINTPITAVSTIPEFPADPVPSAPAAKSNGGCGRAGGCTCERRYGG